MVRNSKPQFESIDRNQSVAINQPFEIIISAFDVNSSDEITIQFAPNVRVPASLQLKPVTGQGRINTILRWEPDCSLLLPGENSRSLDLVLEVSDNACPVSLKDTMRLNINFFDYVREIDAFKPPNVFTPNGDGLNDVFRLSGNSSPSQNLPVDNCMNAFEYVLISNRSGIPVFRSEDRNFTWTGGDLPAGVYYYLLKYSNDLEFKGYLHMLR